MSNGEDIALWIIAICLVIQTSVSLAGLTRLAGKSYDPFRKGDPRNTPNRIAIRKAIAAGRYDEALKTALDRQGTHPSDVYARYDAGLCYYYLKDWEKARTELLEAQRLAPTWEKDWTGPYLRSIEQQIASAKKETA